MVHSRSFAVERPVSFDASLVVTTRIVPFQQKFGPIPPYPRPVQQRVSYPKFLVKGDQGSAGIGKVLISPLPSHPQIEILGRHLRPGVATFLQGFACGIKTAPNTFSSARVFPSSAPMPSSADTRSPVAVQGFHGAL